MAAIVHAPEVSALGTPGLFGVWPGMGTLEEGPSGLGRLLVVLERLLVVLERLLVVLAPVFPSGPS